MEENKKQYLLLLSEIIAKEAIILGPDIAVFTARNAGGLVVDNDGSVKDIIGDAPAALKKIVDEYDELSCQIDKSAIGAIFEKYPQIKKVD